MCPEPRIPGAERLFPLVIQHARANLEQETRAAFAPLHLLFFHHALADHLVHRGFDTARTDALTVAVPLTIVGDKAGIVRDVRVELLRGFLEFAAVLSLLVAPATSGSPSTDWITWKAW